MKKFIGKGRNDKKTSKHPRSLVGMCKGFLISIRNCKNSRGKVISMKLIQQQT